MMRNDSRSAQRLAILVGAAASVLLITCEKAGLGAVKGSGNRVAEERSVSAFTKIGIYSSANIEVTVGGPQKIVVQADDNLLPIITTDVNDGRLAIASSKSYSSQAGVTVTISVPSLEELEIGGSGDASVSGLSGERFRGEIRGSGNLEAEGTVQKVEADVRGSGDLDLFQLPCEEAEASVSGSGDIGVNPSQSLRVTIAGSGNVIYMGEPAIESEIDGTGEVQQR